MEKDDLSIGSDASIVVLNPEEQEDAVVGILVDMVKKLLKLKKISYKKPSLKERRV